MDGNGLNEAHPSVPPAGLVVLTLQFDDTVRTRMNPGSCVAATITRDYSMGRRVKGRTRSDEGSCSLQCPRRCDVAPLRLLLCIGLAI